MKRDIIYNHTVPELLLKMWEGDKINNSLYIHRGYFWNLMDFYIVFIFLLNS